MRRIELAFTADDRAILVEGSAVDAETWSYGDDEVCLHASDGAVVARGVAGPLSRSVLPSVTEIKVFAVEPAGVQQVRTLPKRER